MAKTLTPQQLYQKECYGNRLSPKGRLNRKEYLGSIILYVALGGIFYLLGLGSLNKIIGRNIVGFIVFGIFALLVLWQALKIIMAIIKRLHDLNKTGWLIILPIVSYAVLFSIQMPARVADIFQLVLYIFWGFMNFTRGTIGDNKYGKDPLDKVA